MAELEWSAEDEASLALAVGLLEKETLTDTLLGVAGAAAKVGMKGVRAVVPANVGDGLGDVLSQVLQFSVNNLPFWDRPEPNRLPSPWSSRAGWRTGNAGRLHR